MSERMRNRPEDEMTLEEGLKAVLTRPPDPAFAQGLEQRLLAKADAAEGRDSLLRRRRDLLAKMAPATPRFHWAAIPLAVLAILLIGLLIVGPQRAWAGLQAWLGYVPGVGFVDLENTRVLLAPAAETRDGVTLRVTEVIAGPEETTVVVESEGLPPEDELWGQNGAEADDAFAPLLRLPDGRALEAETFTLRLGRATLLFPPLPENVYRATLELPSLPLVPPGAAPEKWSVPLALQPATGELVTEMYPQPYRPEGATDTHHGITLSVLEVAHTAEKTVFTVQTEWQEESWEYVHPGFELRLYDDLGHLYGDYAEPSSGTVATLVERVQPGEAPPSLSSQRTFDFVPVSPAANPLTFEVPQVEARVPATGTFTVDLGEDPHVGDSWDLDVHLDVTGFPVHITRAWIGTEQLGRGSDPEERTNLYFYLEAVPDQERRGLSSISLFSDDLAFRGGGSSGQQVLSLHLADDETLPTGAVEVYVDKAWVAFHGPWRLQWPLPATTGKAPTVLDPDGVDTANGVTLRLDSVTLTDRITAVDVALAEGPAGSALQEILHGIPGREASAPLLEDDRLHEYQFEGGNLLWWQPDGLEPPTAIPPPALSKRLHFPAARPLARRLTLQIPAVSLALPGEAAFTVEVPENLAFTRAEYGDLVSEPWPVDGRFTIAGYDVHFTEARLQGTGPVEKNIWLTGVAEAQGNAGRGLYGLRVGAITAPDGRLLQGEQVSGLAFSGPLPDIYSAGMPVPGDEGASRVTLRFPVNNPATGQLQPGRYRVALEGVNELVEGPWEFSWPLDTGQVPVARAGAGSQTGLVVPYGPEGATDTAGGVTLQVLAVAHTEEETAIQAQARWQNAIWEWVGFDAAGGEGAPALRGEDGRVYEAVSPPAMPVRVEVEVVDPSHTPTPPPPGAVAEDTAWFEPLSAGTRRLVLDVDQLWFRAELRQRFDVDLGAHPQIGDRWPLDVTLNAGGFPVRITGVRLEAGEDEYPFRFVFGTQVEQGEAQILESLLLTLGRNADFGGSTRSSTGRYSLTSKLEPTIVVETLPASPFTVVADSASMAVQGPWEVTWEVPR